MRPGQARGHGRGRRPPLVQLVTVAFLTLVAAAASAACSSDDAAPAPGETGAAPTATTASAQSTPEARPDKAAAQAGQRFLSAFARGRYGELWGLLAAAPRKAWGSPETLSAFLSRKFGGRKLGIELGEPSAPAPWRDPDTGVEYGSAFSVPYKLRADGRDVPEFSLVPVVVAEEEGEWRVAGLGPAGRRAPSFAPAPAAQGSLDVPILVYHHVAPEWPADFEGRTITVLSADFEGELAYMQGAGYRSITLAELANAMFYGLPLPEKPVILTFDDGYEDNFLYAFPLLQKYGFVGSFAVVTSFLDHPGYMSWDEVRQMTQAGMEFVSHSANHVDLGAATAEAAAAEVRESRKAIQEKASQPVQALVYPYGEPFAHGSGEAQARVVEILRQEGYAVGVTNPLPNTWPEIKQDAAAPYQLNRVMVSGGMGLTRFAARLEGREPQ